jgi:chromosome segregation ATPase
MEKERLQNDYYSICKKAESSQRQILVLQESLRRTESTLKEKTELIHSLHERIERIEGERDEAQHKCGTLSTEVSELQTSIVSIRLELEVATEERESFREKFQECETRYEEIRESYNEFEQGSSGTEYELANLRTMLREVREQKEKAITMRSTADRERDEAISRYEEKCREIERLEENFSQQFHSHGRAGGRTVTRHIFKAESRSGSMAHGFEEDEL